MPSREWLPAFGLSRRVTNRPWIRSPVSNTRENSGRRRSRLVLGNRAPAPAGKVLST